MVHEMTGLRLEEWGELVYAVLDKVCKHGLTLSLSLHTRTRLPHGRTGGG